MPEFTAMKFKVNNPEHSKQIQECLFRLRYSWGMRSLPKECQHTVSKYLYTELDGSLLHGHSDSCFSIVGNTETTLEELKAMLGDIVHHAEQEPTSDSIPEHNVGLVAKEQPTMTQFLHQLQKRLALAELSLYISSNEIQVSDLGSDQLARVESYEELIKAIEVKEQFMNMFKEI